MIKAREVEQRVNTYKNELSAELGNIMGYWINNTKDIVDGGFYGKIDNDNQVIPNSPKGSVLNARILWSFSAAYNLTCKKEYLQIADKAYRYIIDHILDDLCFMAFLQAEHGKIGIPIVSFAEPAAWNYEIIG